MQVSSLLCLLPPSPHLSLLPYLLPPPPPQVRVPPSAVSSFVADSLRPALFRHSVHPPVHFPKQTKTEYLLVVILLMNFTTRRSSVIVQASTNCSSPSATSADSENSSRSPCGFVPTPRVQTRRLDLHHTRGRHDFIIM